MSPGTLKLALKALPYALGLALLIFLGSQVYSYIFDRGANSVQVQWDKEKAEHTQAIEDLKQEYADKEEGHRAENRRISSELSQANLDHANAVAALCLDYAQRLRNVEQRAAIYQRQAQGGAAERGDLADHASRLDAALEEGRSLVRELRETLGLRDRQVQSLSNQIRNDRALFEDAPQ